MPYRRPDRPRREGAYPSSIDSSSHFNNPQVNPRIEAWRAALPSTFSSGSESNQSQAHSDARSSTRYSTTGVRSGSYTSAPNHQSFQSYTDRRHTYNSQDPLSLGRAESVMTSRSQQRQYPSGDSTVGMHESYRNMDLGRTAREYRRQQEERAAEDERVRNEYLRSRPGGLAEHARQLAERERVDAYYAGEGFMGNAGPRRDQRKRDRRSPWE